MGQFLYTAQAVDDGEVFTSTCCADDEGQVRSDLKRLEWWKERATQRSAWMGGVEW